MNYLKVKLGLRRLLITLIGVCFVFSAFPVNGVHALAASVKRPSIKSVESKSDTKVVINWEGISDVDGYIVYQSKNGDEYKKVATVKGSTKTSHTQSKLKAATKYSYKIRTYKTKLNKTTYGAYSKAKTVYTKPALPKIISAEALTENSIKINWGKVAGVKGYVVYQVDGKNYKKIATIKSSKRTYIVNGLKSGKTYKFAVRTFFKPLNTNIYSLYSKTYSVNTINKIKCSKVKGVWYAKGMDDVTFKFIIKKEQVGFDCVNFDYTTGVMEPNSGRSGMPVAYSENGYFHSPSIILVGDSKLVYTINNKTTIFYRKKNYPKAEEWPHETLVRKLDGYYWYLDGYKYAYLHPTVEDWYDHKVLSWKSENIDINNNKLTAYENYSYAKYTKIDSQAECNCHNNLMVNPLEFADSLINDYSMKIEGKKLYMTVGGKKYCFTRYASRKKVAIKITLSEKKLTNQKGDSTSVNFEISPFWAEYSLYVNSSNPDIVDAYIVNGPFDNGRGEICVVANNVGTATITVRDTYSNTAAKIKVIVEPVSVTGISLDTSSIQLVKGDTQTVKAEVLPDNATNKKIIWSTNNESVATVTSSGKITAVDKGTAIITATTDDGKYTAKCEVDVVYPPLTATCSIGYYLQISNGVTQGIEASVDADGGSGLYSYYIELYYNDILIAKTNNNSINNVKTVDSPDGLYKAVYTVWDSEGNEYSGTETIYYTND